MARPKAPLASPDDIEHQFYDALQHADIDQLMACWSDDDEIVCVLPGGPRLVGAVAIRSAFEQVFARFNSDETLPVTVPCVKVWRRMVVVVHHDDDPQKPTDFRQSTTSVSRPNV